MSPTPTVFEIERDTTANYLYWIPFWTPLVFPLGLLFGAGVVIGLVYLYWPGRELARRRAAALSYRLEGTTLRVDGGVYFLSRKSIPLDRITDLVLYQDPFMRHMSVWSLHVQTAGSGFTEATLIGLKDPQGVRALLLAERDRVCARG